MKIIICPFTEEILEVKIIKEIVNNKEIDYHYYENSKGNQFTTDELDKINLKQLDNNEN